MKVYTTVDWGVRKKLRKLKTLFYYCYIHEYQCDVSSIVDYTRPVDFKMGVITEILDQLEEWGCIREHPVTIGTSLHKMTWGRTIQKRWKSFVEYLDFKPHKFTVGEPECLD